MNSQRLVDVFLLAENRLLREALLRILTKKGDIRVVGANPYSAAVHDDIISKTPGILVIDSSGLTASNSSLMATIQAALPEVRIVMVDMDADENTFLRAVREGAVGYVLKDASAAEVAATIRAVAVGEAVCPPTLSSALFRYASQQPDASPTLWGAELGLSRREQQLVHLLRQGLTNKEIAAQLHLSEQTVKNHVHNIMRKVGANDRLSAVRRCEMERFRSDASGN